MTRLAGDYFCLVCHEVVYHDQYGECRRCGCSAAEHIVRLVPMPGWKSVYKATDGKPLIVCDVVGLAITVDGSARWVDCDSGGGLEFCDDAGNFDRILSPTDEDAVAAPTEGATP